MQQTQRAVKTYGNYIAGEWGAASSGETYETRNPARTDELVGRYPLSTSEDVDKAVEAAYRAFQEWREVPAPERMEYVHGLIELWRRRRDELAEAVTLEMGKPILEARSEVDRGIGEMRFTAGEALRVGGETRPSGRRDLLAYTVREPIGVVAAVTPWNTPLMIAAWKLAPALAAGCTVVLKPDPQTPLTAIRLAELASEAGFPAGVINIVPGDGPTTGAYLVRHPGVDKIAFTGSTKTGGEIMRLASDPVKRVILELGGKSPNLVFADADLASALPSSAWAIFYSAGQSCEARSRLLVEQPLYDEVVSKMAEYAGALKVGDPLDPETQMGSLVSIAHRERVHGFVERGTSEGAEVVTGGAIPDGAGAFYPPTVVAATNDLEIAQEEVFGPVVTVTPFEDEKDAIQLANDVKYGLMATVWTRDPARGHRIAARIRAGTVGINMPYTAFPGIPFGGYKQSGFGRELGLETLELYLETKSVLVSTSPKPFNPFGL